MGQGYIVLFKKSLTLHFFRNDHLPILYKMKKIIAFSLIVSLSAGIMRLSAQHDTTFSARKQALENLEVYRTTITDSTKDVLKDLLGMQNEIIAADKPIIEVYLDSLKDKADSLTRIANNLTNDKAELDKTVKAKDKLIFYGMIGAGAIVLLLILFLILFFITSSKKNKYKKQISDVEKMKQDILNKKEQLLKDAETIKVKAQKDITDARENVSHEIKNLNAKIDTLNTEKSNLEKRISDKINEYTQLQVQSSSAKDDLNKRINSLNLDNIDLRNKLLSQEKEISERLKQIDEILREKDNLRKDFSDYKDMYENEVREKQAMEEKMKEMGDAPSIDPQYVETLKAETEKFKEDIRILNERVEKEVKTKEMIEDELRRFIEELKNI
jgi:myosin heavy subunit